MLGSWCVELSAGLGGRVLSYAVDIGLVVLVDKSALVGEFSVELRVRVLGVMCLIEEGRKPQIELVLSK